MFHTQRLWTGFIALCLSAVAHPVPCVKGAEPQEQMLQLKHQFDAQRKAGQLDAAAQTGQELLALAEKALPGASEIIGSILNDLSLIYGDLGKYEQARAAIERALTLAEKSAGKDSPQAAAVHFNLAAVLRKLEQDDQAAAHYQRCIEIVAAQFGPQYAHPVNTSSLNNLAEIYRRRRDLARAEQLHKQALAIREKSLPPDHRDLATSLGNLGLVYFEQGRYSEAEPLYRRAMQIEEKLGAAALPQLKASLHNLGRLFQKQARYEDAVQVFQRLLGLAQQQDGPDAADAIHNIAQARLRQGQYAEAEKLERQAIDIWQRVRGPGHPDVALGAGSLAAILEAQGKFTEADLLHQQMSAILAKSLGPNHPLVCDSLNSRASLCESQRQPQRAEEFYQQALRLGEQIYGPNHPKLADTLSGLGRTYFSMGRYADAELLIKRALAIRTAALGSSHPDVAACLNDLAALCTEQSRYQEAEPLYREAIAIGQQILGREHAQVGETLGNLAWMYLEQGRLSEALLLMQQAFAIRTRILPAGHIDLASLQNNMAVSCFRAGKYDKAADLLQTSLDTYQRVLGDHHPAVALTLNNLAYVEKEMGNLSRAKQLVDRAIALCKATRTPPMHLANSHYLRAELLWRANQRDAALADLEQALGMYEQQRGSGTGGETERANLFGRFSPAFERMIGWQIEQGAIARALSAAERARSRSLVDQLQLQGVDLLAGVPEPEAMALRKRDAECRLRLAELERQLQVVGAQPQLAESERRQRLLRLVDELDPARCAVIAVYRDVRTASPAYRLAVGAKFEPVPLDQLQAWLAHDKAILLEYALGQQAGYLFVVPAEGQARAVELTVTPEQAQSLGCEPGPLTADRLKSIFTLGGKELLKQLSNPRAAAEASSRLAQLWQLLIPAPQREQLTGGEFNKLIVVPDGALALLPFETLVVRDGEKPQYLLESGPPVVYAPSATVLYNLSRRKPQQPPPPGVKAVLSVGDPAYRKAPLAVGAEQSRQVLDELGPQYRFARLRGELAPLPYSAIESDWVASAFNDHGMTTIQLRKAEATEGNLRSNMHGRQVVHLACHGFVDQAFGNFFGALAVAPAGRDAAGPTDDGFLTLAEIYELDLRACQLALLSACETNYGPEQKGEGVWALSRGFLVAGAQRVVATDWLVDDEAAASLVSYFCSDAMKTKRPDGTPDYAGALHRAKRWVRNQEKWSSPYYWASFVMIGPD